MHTTSPHWLPMHVAGDHAKTVHAVLGQKALCGAPLPPGAEGWLWQRGHGVTCAACRQRHIIVEARRNPRPPVTRRNEYKQTWREYSAVETKRLVVFVCQYCATAAAVVALAALYDWLWG
jgi:hypothetical protein